MQQHNYCTVNLDRIYRENVKPGLTEQEARAMERAIGVKPIKKLFTKVAGKIHWYILNAPTTLRGKCFGTANSEQEAEQIISRLLGENGKKKTVLT